MFKLQKSYKQENENRQIVCGSNEVHKFIQDLNAGTKKYYSLLIVLKIQRTMCWI